MTKLYENSLRIVKLSIFSIISYSSIVFAEPTPVGPINFSKGVNYSAFATDISDDESPDMCNCINDTLGSVTKRNGNKRYVDQAISSYPVTSLYRAYSSDSGTSYKTLIATTKDKILHSTGGINPIWVLLSTQNTESNYSWLTMSDIDTNKFITIGVGGLNNTIKRFDVATASMSDLISFDGSTTSINLASKYGIMSKNYLILGNVRASNTTNVLAGNTTYYTSRIYYSLLAKPSSMTAIRYIDYRTNDGEEITGLGNLFNVINIFKPSSIGELSFNILNPSTLGGDWQLSEVVNGFGLYAPKSLASNGQFYTFCSQDGVRVWDGGRRGRLTAAEESRIISTKIKNLVDRLIRSGTWSECVGTYYKKKDWYVLSYRDPEKFPKNKLNSILVYDFKTGEWFPYCNMQAGSFANFDNESDNGNIFYGDSTDGYVYEFDSNVKSDDSRKELVIDPMENQNTWTSSYQDTSNVKEGTASLKICTSNSVLESSMTIIKPFIIGEWKDGTKVTKDDNFAFKVFTENLSKISNIRIDLQVDIIDNAFDTNFTSVTISSGALVEGWNTVEVKLSSFPIRSDWTDLELEVSPFANTIAYYGIRFVLNSVDRSTVSIDDVRLVQNTDNPISAYRFTKLFNLGSMAYKGFGQVILTYDKSPEASFNFDIYNDFGKKIRTQTIEPECPKELIYFGGNPAKNIYKIKSNNFELITSTYLNRNILLFNGVANKDYIYAADRFNDYLVKIDRNNLGYELDSFGSHGDGTDQFNTIHQLSMDTENLFLVDQFNQRIKEHKINDFSFVQMVGSLGRDATSYHQPTGIAVDENNVYLANEGNYKLFKLDKSTFGIVLSADIDYNTIGETSLAVDENYIYLCYNKISDENVLYQDILLEKRDKGDLSLINRKKITKNNAVSLSTYSISGDIALLGKYIFVPFSDDENYDSNTHYYLQKLLKSDFSLVDELQSSTIIHSVLGYPYSYNPITKTARSDLNVTGRYFQLKFYDNSIDNYWKLYNQTFLVEIKPLTY